MRVSRKRYRSCGEHFSGLNRYGVESGVAASRPYQGHPAYRKIPVHLTLMRPVLNIACARIHGTDHDRPVFRVSSRPRHDLSARDAYAASARLLAQAFDPAQRSRLWRGKAYSRLGRQPDHAGLEQAAAQPCSQPRLKGRQVLFGKPARIHARELAHEWKYRQVGSAWCGAAQIGLTVEPGLQRVAGLSRRSTSRAWKSRLA